MDQEHVKEQIKADLTFAHHMMMATAQSARLLEQQIEAERSVLHALIGRMTAAVSYRGMPLRAMGRYERLFVDPQRRRVEQSRVHSAAGRAQANVWSRAYDDCIERASAYRGHAS